MTVEEYRHVLRGLPQDQIPDYLDAHSGLPGPRSNLTLLAALVEEGSADLILALADRDDEYPRSCGTAGLGRLLAEGVDVFDVLHTRAADDSWRVREAAAMALQRLGDDAPERMRGLVAGWAADDDPLVRRAAVAGICEPRLLRDPVTALAALDACEVATRGLLAVPVDQRRDPDVRTLRQGLGYCWSVAVAGAPEPGVDRFLALESSEDADLRWIVRENRKKARLRTLLPA